MNNDPLRAYSIKNRFILTLCSLALISFSLILYEIILTRIFAVLLSYHYVFAVLSLAMLGLGMGGLVLTKWVRSGKNLDTTLFTILTAFILAIVTSLILYLSQSSSASWGSTVTWIILFLPTLPFLFFGITIASFFQQAPEKSSLLYGVDIVGGALAALAASFLLNNFPPTFLVYVLVIVVAFTSIILGVINQVKFIKILFSITILLLGISGTVFSPDSLFPIKSELNKDINRILNDYSESWQIVETRWNAFGQTDLVESELFPGEKMIYIDGAAGTSMYNYNAILTDSVLQQNLTTNYGEFFPFLFLKRDEKDSALIIGPGGGRDVLVALFGGVKSITAVEVNPDFVQIVKDYEDFNGGLYSKFPNVNLIVEEGRRFLRNTDNTYDLIMMALPVTKSSRSINGYSLTENYLFTVEAFKDYLDRLTPEGRIIIVTHGKAELYRLLSLVLTAFDERGISNEKAMDYIYTVAKQGMPTLVIRKTPFIPEDIQIRHAALHEMRFDEGTYFFPFQEQASFSFPNPTDSTSTIEWNMFDQYLVDLSDGTTTVDEIAKELPIDISPVTDESPFFYNFDKKLPSPFRQLYSLVVLGFVIVLILISVKNPSPIIKINAIHLFAKKPELKGYLLIFVLLGIGFMMLEISFFQKLTFYLGNPVLTTSVLLFSLLLGVGLGSLTSIAFNKNLPAIILVSSIVTFILSLGYNSMLEQLMDLPFQVSLKAGVLTGILGYFMGFPFPLTLRLMKQNNLGQFTSMMWGVNGLASVAGSITAMIIGIEWGFTNALNIGGGMYLTIVFLVVILKVGKESSD